MPHNNSWLAFSEMEILAQSDKPCLGLIKSCPWLIHQCLKSLLMGQFSSISQLSLTAALPIRPGRSTQIGLNGKLKSISPACYHWEQKWTKTPVLTAKILIINGGLARCCFNFHKTQLGNLNRLHPWYQPSSSNSLLFIYPSMVGWQNKVSCLLYTIGLFMASLTALPAWVAE